MVVEVVAGDVRDHRDVEVTTRHALLGQAVRRHLQHRIARRCVDHSTQIALEVRGIGRGRVQSGVDPIVADLSPHRRYKPNASPGSA